jgi:hypothetical protein
MTSPHHCVVGGGQLYLQECVMTPSRQKTYLVLTKLHRPPLPPDLVTRSDLGIFFDPDFRQFLTLVCAWASRITACPTSST